MFTYGNLATNVKPDLGPVSDCTKVAPLAISEYKTLINCDHNMSRYVKIIRTCHCRSICYRSLRTPKETEQLVSPRKCLSPVKNWTIATVIEIQHLAQFKI